MRERKFYLAALMTYEVGKTWKEADADVAEAIDFCDYYATQATTLFTSRKTQEIPGEDNFYSYQPWRWCCDCTLELSTCNCMLMTVASLDTWQSNYFKAC